MHLDFIFAKAKLAYQMKATGPGWEQGRTSSAGPATAAPRGAAVPQTCHRR